MQFVKPPVFLLLLQVKRFAHFLVERPDLDRTRVPSTLAPCLNVCFVMQICNEGGGRENVRQGCYSSDDSCHTFDVHSPHAAVVK